MPIVHNVQSAPGELQHLIASPSRLCGLSGSVAAVFSVDNSERPWTAPLDNDATPVSVCFSLCGNFLAIGDNLGVLSVVYLPFKRKVWSKVTTNNAGLAKEKILEVEVGENGDLSKKWFLKHFYYVFYMHFVGFRFVLFSGSIMLRFESMMFTKLHELLSGMVADNPATLQIIEEFSTTGTARTLIYAFEEK